MKYRMIIQDMKESGDANVLAFLKDAEKIKPMSKRERDYCLQNRYRPELVQKLVEEFIPYIIWVAYTFGGTIAKEECEKMEIYSIEECILREDDQMDDDGILKVVKTLI